MTFTYCFALFSTGHISVGREKASCPAGWLVLCMWKGHYRRFLVSKCCHTVRETGWLVMVLPRWHRGWVFIYLFLRAVSDRQFNLLVLNRNTQISIWIGWRGISRFSWGKQGSFSPGKWKAQHPTPQTEVSGNRLIVCFLLGCMSIQGWRLSDVKFKSREIISSSEHRSTGQADISIACLYTNTFFHSQHLSRSPNLAFFFIYGIKVFHSQKILP